MHAAIVIPARYDSSRLPGKPLLRETGKYLIQHVYERAVEARATWVIVATDDTRIADAVNKFGGNVVMTRADHVSGTDRVAEVAQKIDAEIIINLQGDEPLVDADHLNLLPQMLNENRAAQMATLAVPIKCMKEYQNPNSVKVVCDEINTALYFSRSPIPFVRDGEPNFDGKHQFLRHVGLYAYRREFLLKLAATPPSRLEQLEKLEQLRALGMGIAIKIGIIGDSQPGIDTPDDYRQFVQYLQMAQQDRAA